MLKAPESSIDHSESASSTPQPNKLSHDLDKLSDIIKIRNTTRNINSRDLRNLDSSLFDSKS